MYCKKFLVQLQHFNVRLYGRLLSSNLVCRRELCNYGLNSCAKQLFSERSNSSQTAPTDSPEIKDSNGGKKVLFNWKIVSGVMLVAAATVGAMNYSRMKVLQAQEYERKTTLGKARLGGSWELINTDGKTEGSEQLLGNWLLIYFGFTNCPDICPVEIEKMINAVDDLEKDERLRIPIVPVFISIDPQRDSADRVKKYCKEFSPKLRGYTGSVDQVEKVAKAFRVYHSEGPKSAEDDYIVDHTVIMYLIGPDGEFQDYFGQNRSFVDVANSIRGKVLKYQASLK